MKNQHYNCVVSWNRGGSSALMTALKQSGIPILGFKYPIEYKFDYINQEDNSVIKQQTKDGGLLEPLHSVKQVNPTGYWEVPSICIKEGLQKKHYDLGFDGDLVKVPFNMIPISNPDLIDKVVIILRHPASVIKSQYKSKKIKESLEVWTKTASLGLLHNAVMSMEWFKKYKKTVLIVKYEDLLKDTFITLNRICIFLERGDPNFGAKVIDQKLNRSKPVKVNCKELDNVIEFYKNPKDWNKYNLEEIRKQIKKLDKSGMTDIKTLHRN